MECETKKMTEEKRKIKGAPGIEPGTSRSAVECSTTELYPLTLTVVAEVIVMMLKRHPALSFA